MLIEAIPRTAAVAVSDVQSEVRFARRPPGGWSASGSIRNGVELGLTATAGVIGPVLVAQAMPSYLADRAVGGPLSVVSLVLALLSCLAVLLGLPVSAGRRRVAVLAAVAGFYVLAALESIEMQHLSSSSVMPWLVAISPFYAACVAIAFPRLVAALVCGGTATVVVVVVYAGHLPLDHLVPDAALVLAFYCSAVIGVGFLRSRASLADSAEDAAARRFEASRREVALEEERVRSDALLHDSVLGTLLVAAAARTDESRARAVRMATSALEVVSDTYRDAPDRAARVTFARAIAAVERDLAPMRGLIQVDFIGVSDLLLPERVADTLVAAMLQAISNSIKHAGPYAGRVVRASRTVDGGVQITIRDDGRGFDIAQVDPARLGLRISIIERVQLIGGRASVRSVPGSGTTVSLRWAPENDQRLVTTRPMQA